MPDISIRVRDKIATADGDQTIVCGNADYTVTFDLDAEWGEYDIKTMRVNWLDTFSGQPRHADVVFSGTRASLPAITDAYEVGIGLYAGNIRATTAARIPCTRCVTDGGTYHDDPPPDEYAQLIALLQRMTEAGFGRVGDSTPIIDGFNLAMVGQHIIYYDKPTLVLTITKTRQAQGYGQFSELKFYDENYQPITPDIDQISTNATQYSASEGVEKCLDGNIDTKWLWYWQNPTTLTVELSSDFRPAYVSYVTGNDGVGWDPVSFTLERKYHADTTTILDVQDAEITSSRKTETQKFALNYAEVE